MHPDSRSQDQPFEGGAFHPQLAGGRASGLISLSFSGARFESEKGAFDLPLDGLKLELGGANDRLIFLSHPAHPQVTIHTADHALLDHPVVAQTPALTAQRSRVKSKQRTAAAVLLSVVGLLIAGIVALFLSRDVLVKAAANAVPVSWEVSAGDKLFEQLMITRREIKDLALHAQLAELTQPLVKGIADNPYPLEFHIVEDPTLNAFAIPGGNVVLHSGLLLAAETPEEVAGVLAHEIAHVTQRHSVRNIISSAGLYLALSAILGDVSGVVGVLADNSAFLLDRKFSRDFERDADDTGWDYLVASDITPKGMIGFFKKMQAEEKKLLEKLPAGGMGKALEMLSTHPATAERIERLEKRWEKHGREERYRNIPLNYSAFKDNLRAQLHSPGSPQRPE